jgi:large subunit ribosomal protein L1
MAIRSKKYKEVLNLIDKKKTYSLAEACELVKKTSTCRFDASVEIAVKLNLDTTKAEQQLRGNIALPHYFGKTTKILILDDNLTAEKAKEAKIDYFGGNEQIQRIKEG